MPKEFNRFLDSLNRAASFEEIHGACDEICQHYGFNHFLYGARIPTSFVKPKILIINSFPDAWWGHYKERSYMAVDPVLAACSRNYLPVNWSSLASVVEKDSTARRFMNEAQSFGLNSGASFPLHSAQGEFALLTLSSKDSPDRTQKRIARTLPFAQALTAFVHEAVRRVVDIEVLPAPNARLSKRERECLLWAAEGKTSWEISQILGISERTVIFHLQNSAAKLGVSNRQQAVARAVSLALITPCLD